MSDLVYINLSQRILNIQIIDILSNYTIPITINNVLDSYFSKEPEILAIIDTAISYSVSAMEYRQYKKTLSILCSFTSMETMVNLEFRNDKPETCSECGQL